MDLIIISVLVLGCCWLVIERLKLRREIADINEVITKISYGDLHRRVNIKLSNHKLQQQVANLNKLMDQFQDTVERKNYLEKARKELISNISHDLRTPLTSMLGYVEALQNDSELTSEERQRFLEIIANKGSKLYDLLQEFFELSKLESGDRVVKCQAVNLTEKVKETLVLHYNEFQKLEVELEIQLPEQDLYVWGEASSIERIFSNLISNALRYGKDGGVVGIAIREESELVWVDVWDRGNGINSKDLPYIFERSYTADMSRSNRQHGSGL